MNKYFARKTKKHIKAKRISTLKLPRGIQDIYKEEPKGIHNKNKKTKTKNHPPTLIYNPTK